MVEVAAEKNSTLVLPFPVELLRFLDTATKSTAAAMPAPQGEPGKPDAEAPQPRGVEQLELPPLDEVLAAPLDEVIAAAPPLRPPS